MSDYISREAVAQFIRSYRHSTDVAFDMEKRLDDIPAADVRPVVRGGWEEHGEPNGHGKYELWYYSCTRCGAVGIPQYNFCPNCGADMREER